MKRVSIIFIIFLLITSVFCNVFATTPEQPVEQTVPAEPDTQQTETPQDAANQETQLI